MSQGARMPTPAAPAIPSAFSVYLDLVRIAAALLVFLSHITSVRLYGIDRFGHDSVIAFFVLSGLVIANAVAVREHDLRSFALARLARLYSVTLPALGLIAVVLISARLHGHVVSIAADIPLPLLLLTNALFLNEIWFTKISAGSSWSLSYEAFYYALFAAWVFCRGRRRAWAVAVAAGVAGPCILLLLPVWLLGIALWRWRPRGTRRLGLALALGMPVLYFAYRGIMFETAWHPPVIAEPDFGLSNYFANDYIVGALVALQFAGARMLEPWLAPAMARIAGPVRFLAGFTFSLYLYHVPLLHLLLLVVPWGSYGIIPAVLLATGVIGWFTERRKHVVRRWLEALAPPSPGSLTRPVT